MYSIYMYMYIVCTLYALSCSKIFLSIKLSYIHVYRIESKWKEFEKLCCVISITKLINSPLFQSSPVHNLLLLSLQLTATRKESLSECFLGGNKRIIVFSIIQITLPAASALSRHRLTCRVLRCTLSSPSARSVLR